MLYPRVSQDALHPIVGDSGLELEAVSNNKQSARVHHASLAHQEWGYTKLLCFFPLRKFSILQTYFADYFY